MCATGYCYLRQPLLEAMDDVGEDFSTKDDGDRTALYYHMHVGTIIF